jgi:hypothetical protein
VRSLGFEPEEVGPPALYGKPYLRPLPLSRNYNQKPKTINQTLPYEDTLMVRLAAEGHIDGTVGGNPFCRRPYVCVSGTVGAVQTYINSKKMPQMVDHGITTTVSTPVLHTVSGTFDPIIHKGLALSVRWPDSRKVTWVGWSSFRNSWT